MLPMLILTVFLGIISRSIAFVEYTSTIINESLTLFENPLFSFEIKDSDKDSMLYLIIAKPIENIDQLYLEVTAERSDGVKFPIPHDPIALCDLLEEEAMEQNNNTLSNLRFSRVFNMEGTRCPIPAGKRRLMPYMFPPYIKLYNDIGCGYFNYKVTLEKSKKNEPKDYIPIISTETIIDLQADHCSNVLM